MDLKDILSISGKPGLYKNVAQTKTGVIVESLLDGKRLQAFQHEKISSLGEISIFTTGEEMPLREVYRLAREKFGDEQAPDNKAGDDQLKAYFESIVPEYDHEKVYVSHMRKMASWYNLLIANGITDFSEKMPEIEEQNEATVPEPDPGQEPAENKE